MIAGANLPRPSMAQAMPDETGRRVVRVLEDRLRELESRLTDAERRLKAGGL